jgi:serine/threonine protein kinase
MSAYDYRCDVWSLGVLCYMLLSGAPPFHGNTADDVYEGILNQEVVYPEKKFRYLLLNGNRFFAIALIICPLFCRHLSASCMDFLRRLLIKDPNLRMSTAVALAHPYISGTLSAPVENFTQTQPAAVVGINGTFSVSSTSSGPIQPSASTEGDLQLGNPNHMSVADQGDEKPTTLHSNFTFTPRSLMVHQQQRQHQELLLHTPAAQNLTYTPGSYAAKAAAQVASIASNGTVCVGRFNALEADLIMTRYASQFHVIDRVANILFCSITNFVLADPLIKLTALMVAHSIPPEDVSRSCSI